MESRRKATSSKNIYFISAAIGALVPLHQGSNKRICVWFPMRGNVLRTSYIEVAAARRPTFKANFRTPGVQQGRGSFELLLLGLE